MYTRVFPEPVTPCKSAVPEWRFSMVYGSLAISADVCNLDKKVAKGYKLEYALYANELYSDENVKVENVLV